MEQRYQNYGTWNFAYQLDVEMNTKTFWNGSKKNDKRILHHQEVFRSFIEIISKCLFIEPFEKSVAEIYFSKSATLGYNLDGCSLSWRTMIIYDHTICGHGLWERSKKMSTNECRYSISKSSRFGEKVSGNLSKKSTHSDNDIP